MILRLTHQQKYALLGALVEYSRDENATQNWIDVLTNETVTLSELMTLVATAENEAMGNPNWSKPGYWMNETSGTLAPVIEAYLHGRDLSDRAVGIMRAYLRQWIAAPGWKGDAELEQLRADVDRIKTTDDIKKWLSRACDLEIDPL